MSLAPEDAHARVAALEASLRFVQDQHDALLDENARLTVALASARVEARRWRAAHDGLVAAVRQLLGERPDLRNRGRSDLGDEPDPEPLARRCIDRSRRHLRRDTAPRLDQWLVELWGRDVTAGDGPDDAPDADWRHAAT